MNRLTIGTGRSLSLRWKRVWCSVILPMLPPVTLLTPCSSGMKSGKGEPSALLAKTPFSLIQSISIRSKGQRLFLCKEFRHRYCRLYHIYIFPFWVPSEEHIVADVVSRYDRRKLAKLWSRYQRFPSLQTCPGSWIPFFTSIWHRALGGTMIKSSRNMRRSVKSTNTFPTRRLSKRPRHGVANLILRQICNCQELS